MSDQMESFLDTWFPESSVLTRQQVREDVEQMVAARVSTLREALKDIAEGRGVPDALLEKPRDIFQQQFSVWLQERALAALRKPTP
jgi:uncharacterized protein YllA (UPF0747 family)